MVSYEYNKATEHNERGKMKHTEKNYANIMSTMLIIAYLKKF